jgi:hypothetical protein
MGTLDTGTTAATRATDARATGSPGQPAAEEPVVGRAIAAGRVALGVGALTLPRLATRMLLGRGHGARPVDRMFTRMLGVRDLALGAATLAALQRGRPGAVRRMVLLGAAVDAVDGLVTLRQPAIGRAKRWAIGTGALLAAAGGVWQADQLPQDDPADTDPT